MPRLVDSYVLLIGGAAIAAAGMFLVHDERHFDAAPPYPGVSGHYPGVAHPYAGAGFALLAIGLGITVVGSVGVIWRSSTRRRGSR